MLSQWILNKAGEGCDLTPQSRTMGGAGNGRPAHYKQGSETYEEARERMRRRDLAGGFSEHSIHLIGF